MQIFEDAYIWTEIIILQILLSVYGLAFVVPCFPDFPTV